MRTNIPSLVVTIIQNEITEISQSQRQLCDKVFKSKLTAD